MGSRGLLGARPRGQGSHKRAELGVVLDPAEALGGTHQPEPPPALPHVASAPALHVATHVSQGAGQVLDAVRRREEPTQRGR